MAMGGGRMFDSMKSLFVNRRELFRKGGLLAVPGLLRAHPLLLSRIHSPQCP